jgi:hypothetical protein
VESSIKESNNASSPPSIRGSHLAVPFSIYHPVALFNFQPELLSVCTQADPTIPGGAQDEIAIIHPGQFK